MHELVRILNSNENECWQHVKTRKFFISISTNLCEKKPFTDFFDYFYFLLKKNKDDVHILGVIVIPPANSSYPSKQSAILKLEIPNMKSTVTDGMYRYCWRLQQSE